MNYEELTNYILLRSKDIKFKDIDEFIANIDDKCTDILIDSIGQKFKITKTISNVNFDTGTTECKYSLNIF